MSVFSGWLVNVNSQALGSEWLQSKQDKTVCVGQTFYFILSLFLSLAPLEPLLCKFADGGQKKRQSQNKFSHNGRGWARDGDSRLVSGSSLPQDDVRGLSGWWETSGRGCWFPTPTLEIQELCCNDLILGLWYDTSFNNFYIDPVFRTCHLITPVGCLISELVVRV